MAKLRLHITMSLDGYVAGPDQGEENPLGIGGLKLHEWVLPLREFRDMHGGEGGETNASSAVVQERWANIGSTIMGRNMFGPIRGQWPDDSWRGWWGEDPPYHHPVFVLTQHAREPLQMDGGTTFEFVTDGIEPALARAKDAAKGKDVWLAGGASVINQYLAAGLVDEIDLSIAPLVLGGGERLFEGLERDSLKLTQIRAVDAPGVTHIKYQVG
jgi:dihydrofolate reductase